MFARPSGPKTMGSSILFLLTAWKFVL